MLKRIIILIVLVFAASSANSANLIFKETFDDQSFNQTGNDQSSTVSANISEGGDNPGTYQSPGYGGTGYYRRSDFINTATESPSHLEYNLTGSWPTGYAFVRYKIKFESCSDSNPNGDQENVKLYRMNKGGASDYFHFVVHHPCGDGYAMFNTSSDWDYPNLTNIGDGNWHTISILLNLDTGNAKLWWDTTDYNSAPKAEVTDTSWDWPNRNFSYSFQPADNGVGGTATFYRSYDEIEIWDGLPTAEGDTTPPYVGAQDPADEETGVLVDSDVSFRIYDSDGNLDVNTHANFSFTVAGTTYYCDSENVSCSGTAYNTLVTKSSNSFANATEITVTVDAEDTEGNTMTQQSWSFTTETTGSATATVTSHTQGQLISSPTSQTQTISGTTTNTPTSVSWVCSECSTTSGSASLGAGTFSFDVTLPTQGLGADGVTNGAFASSDSWTLDSEAWSIVGGVAVNDGSGSGYGLWQEISLENYSYRQFCADVSNYSSGELYLSQYGYPGIGNSIEIATDDGNNQCSTPIMVVDESSYMRIVTTGAMDIDNVSDKQYGELAAIVITATNASGATESTLYLNHYTAGADTESPTILLVDPISSMECTSDPRTVTIIVTVTDNVDPSGSLTVKYSTDSGFDIDAEGTAMSGADSTFSATTGNLACGANYSYYVKAKDTSDNVSDAFLVNFNVGTVPTVLGVSIN